MMVIPAVYGAFGAVPEALEKKTGGTRNQRRNWDYPDSIDIKIG